MKKLFAIILACSSLASGAFAECCEGKKAELPSVKIGGKFEFGGVMRSQDSLKDDQKRMSKNIDNAAFYSSAALTADVSANNEDLGLKYGATLGFTPLHSKARPNPSFLYMEGLFGRVELGAGKTVMTQMSIGGWDNACGIGDLWSVHYASDPDSKGIYFMEDLSSNLDFSHRKTGVVEFARKVSYVTPRIYGLQAGISYIPDTANNGHAGYTKDGSESYRNPGIEDVAANLSKVDAKITEADKRLEKVTETPENNIHVTHGFAAGVNYEYDISEEVKVNLAVVGEYAKAKDHQKAPIADNAKKADLFSWVVGGQVTYQDLQVSGSYGNRGDSFASKAQDGEEEAARKSYGYDAGVKYKIGNAAASLSYFHSNAKKNEIDAISLGADYTLAPGLTPYIQAVKFAGTGKYKDLTTIKDDKKADGYLFIIGTRLKF
jgi:predicted porin